jgi:ubiquinone/menaquinone biosynthesis C-methylase UbiE
MPSADELKEQQKQQWSAAATGWERQDRWFDRNTGGLTDWLCTAAGLAPSKRVLDIACGSGQPALTAAARVRPGGEVVATDLSTDMIAVARRKAAAAGIDNVDFREMDAEKLTFPERCFDAVTCRFGLMFCPDPVRAASEMRRVLRPGGRLALSVWDESKVNPFFTVMAGPVTQCLGTPPPDPKAPGVFRLAPPGELESVLRAAGFKEISIESRPMTFEYESIDEYWKVQSDLAAPLRAAMSTLSPPELARLKEMVLAAVEPYREGSSVRLQATPLCATAS